MRELRKYLFRIFSFLAFALTAGARAAAGAVYEGGVVWSARLEMLVEASEFLMRTALASLTEESVVALANAALERAHAVALGRFLLVHVAFALALAVTQHLQIYRESLVYANLKKKSA